MRALWMAKCDADNSGSDWIRLYICFFFFFISWGFLYASGKIGNSLFFFFAVYSMRLQMYKYIVFMYSVSPDSGDLPPYFI
jgi:hypothetical protein